jgi:hypothetical protein
MEQLTFINILLLFCGLLLNATYALQKAKKQEKTFSFGFYIKDNLLMIVGTIIAAFVCLVLAKPLISLCGVTVPDGSPIFTIHAFISGIIPMYFIEKIKKLYK